MRVLNACEFSGVVRRAFRARGHDAWSCDILPSVDNSPYHIQADVRLVLDGWMPVRWAGDRDPWWVIREPEGRLDELRKGRSRVIEDGHTVILGWSQSIFTIEMPSRSFFHSGMPHSRTISDRISHGVQAAITSLRE